MDKNWTGQDRKLACKCRKKRVPLVVFVDKDRIYNNKESMNEPDRGKEADRRRG